MLAKIIIVLFLLAIFFCLGSALYYLMQDRGNSSRMAKALSMRIGISLALFFLLIVAFASGILQPHHIPFLR